MKLHFFTIVYNGYPWINYHYPLFQQLPFPWTWTIVEGLAERVGDSAWMNPSNDLIQEFDFFQLSTDGTKEILDKLERLDPHRVKVIRKWNPSQEGLVSPWNGKTEMVNAALSHIKSPGILMQVDADELWRKDQLEKIYELFLKKKYCFIKYKCHYFFGFNLVLPDHSDEYSWYRNWIFQPGNVFVTHEPPVLNNLHSCESSLNEEESAEFDLVFQHYGYVTEEQVSFKEKYYNDPGFKKSWLALQNHKNYPVSVKKFFPHFPVEGDVNIYSFDQLNLPRLAFFP